MGNPFFWTKYLIRDVTVKSKFEVWKVRQLKILIENGRRPKWKTTKMVDGQNGRRPKRKTIKMDDDKNGRRPKLKKSKK